MQRSILLFACIFAAVFCLQNDYSVSSLPIGVATPGILPTTGPILALNYYSIYVPENSTGVTITLHNLNTTACSYLALSARQDGLPCSRDYPSEQPCYQSYWNDNAGSSDVVLKVLTTGTSGTKQFDWVVGKTWYLGVSRYSSSYTRQCSYTLKVDFAGECAAGQVAVAPSLSYGSTTPNTCSGPYRTASIPSQAYTITSTSNQYETIKVVVPQDTANIRFRMNATADIYGVYGNYGSTPTTSYNDCYDSSGNSASGGYLFDLNCTVPHAGEFFFVIYNSAASTPYSAQVQIDTTVCAPNRAGAQCETGLVDVLVSNISTIAQNGLKLSFAYNSANYQAIQAYIGFETPVNSSLGSYALKVVSSGSGYYYTRVNAIPTYSVYDNYESYPDEFDILPFDQIVPGFQYIGFSCTSTAGCNVTISANATQQMTTGSNTGVSTTGVSTTGQNTGVSTTGGITTGGITSGSTTGAVTTGSRVTTGSSRVTTGSSSTTSGKESSALMIIPCVALMIVAALF